MEQETPVTTETIVPVEQARLWEAYWANPTDLTLRNKIAEMNQRLVYWTLTHRISKSLTENEEVRQELVQEGSIGLLRAIELFDPTKGFSFGTYAPYWIRQAISRHIANTRNPIRIPIHVGEMGAKIRKAEIAFFQQEGHFPSTEEMATFLGLPVEAVVELTELCTPTPVVSSNILLDSEGGSELGDFIADEATPDALEQMLAKQPVTFGELLEKYAPDVTTGQLQTALDELPVRTRQMILLSASDATLETIGRHYSVTRERVRQIIAMGIKRLRLALGVGADLPITSIRLPYKHKDDGEDLVAVHGIDWKTFVERLTKVVEEVRVYGRAKLRLPPSVKMRVRRTRAPKAPRLKVPPERKVQEPKARKPIIVQVISTKREVVSADSDQLVQSKPKISEGAFKRLQLSEQEYAVAAAAWMQLTEERSVNLDFEQVAKEAELAVGRVHLISCALIARGVILQEGAGLYRRGYPHLVVKQNGKESLELDLCC